MTQTNSDDADPHENVTVTVSMPRRMRDEIEDDRDELDMGRSEYVRSMIDAGRRQLAAVDEDGPSSERDALREQILEQLPSDETEAVHQDEIAEEIIDPMQEKVLRILSEEDQIKHSAIHDGFYAP